MSRLRLLMRLRHRPCGQLIHRYSHKWNSRYLFEKVANISAGKDQPVSPSQLDVGKIAHGTPMGLVGIAENRNVDEMGGLAVRPNVAIDLS